MTITVPARIEESLFNAGLAFVMGMVVGYVGLMFGWFVVTGGMPPVAAPWVCGGLCSVLMWLVLTGRLKVRVVSR